MLVRYGLLPPNYGGILKIAATHSKRSWAILEETAALPLPAPMFTIGELPQQKKISGLLYASTIKRTNIRKKPAGGNKFFGAQGLTISPDDSTISLRVRLPCSPCSWIHQPQEVQMKSANLTPKNQPKLDKKLLKRLAMADKRFRLNDKNSQLPKIVKSFTAGHVRGGHSFH
ncbi:MAG: hypothetical protein ACRDGA_14290 [Bacteroidota bacterium]